MYSESVYKRYFKDIPLEELICVSYDPNYQDIYRKYLYRTCSSKCIVLHIADGCERMRVVLLLSHVLKSIDDYICKVEGVAA